MLESILQAVASGSGDGVVVADPDGQLTFVSPAAERLLGPGLSDFQTFLPDGVTPFPADQQPLARALQGQDSDRVEQLIRHRERPGGLAVSVSGRALRDERGSPNGAVLVFREITDGAARRPIDAQSRQAQKMEAIARLAGGIAHDFNDILSVILSHTAMLLEDLDPSSESAGDALQIQAAAERGRRLTAQLVAFSRRQVLRPAPLDLSRVVRALEPMISRLLGDRVEVVLRLGDALSSALLDRGQIEQVLMNLVVNASQAMPDGGRLSIETTNVELDERYSDAHLEVKRGPYVMLSITDTGFGIDPDTEERIFEPFFTTKEHATGLGLAFVHGIVRQSGGHVWGYSEVGRGTTFKLYFPVHGAPAEPSPDSLGPAPRGVGELVLVVEDEALVRRAVCTILRRAGYDVHEAGTGADAIEIAARHQAAIRVIVLDVILGAETGPEVLTRIRHHCPSAQVLFTSGYNEEHVLEQGAIPRGSAFVQKPVTPDALLAAVHRLAKSGS